MAKVYGPPKNINHGVILMLEIHFIVYIPIDVNVTIQMKFKFINTGRHSEPLVEALIYNTSVFPRNIRITTH